MVSGGLLSVGTTGRVGRYHLFTRKLEPWLLQVVWLVRYGTVSELGVGVVRRTG